MTTHPRNNTSRIRVGHRLAVGAGAAALCLGITVPAATPAVAHNTGTAGTTHAWRVSLAEQKAWLDQALAAEANQLGVARAKVENSGLPADKKSELTTRIDRALAAVAAARAAVAAADTEGELSSAIAMAWPAWRVLFVGHGWHHDSDLRRHQHDRRVNSPAASPAALTSAHRLRNTGDARHCDGDTRDGAYAYAAAYEGRHRWDDRPDLYRGGHDRRYDGWDSHRDGGYRNNTYSNNTYSNNTYSNTYRNTYSGTYADSSYRSRSYGGYSGGYSGGWGGHHR